MKKHKLSVLVIITLVFMAFTFGFFLGKNQDASQVIVQIPKTMHTEPAETVPGTEAVTVPTEAISFPIDINSASKEAFMALPGIGEVLAERILAYREEHGYFSVPEELMHVEGIGEKRMEEILDLIKIGGPQ